MSVRPLAPHIGAEIVGFTGSPDIEELRGALAEYHVVVTHLPDLSAEDQVRLIAELGEPVDEGGDGRGHVFVSNAREDGVLAAGKRLVFHSDNVFTSAPLNVVSLYGLRVAPGTAATLFANAERAYDRLDERTRTELVGERALNLSGFAGGWLRYRDNEVEAHHPRAEHPVITEDTYARKPALMVSEQQTDRIIGWNPDRSEQMLQRLFALLYSADNVYAHHWRTGDLVIWDNLAAEHGRPELPGDSGERTLRRVSAVYRDAGAQRPWHPVSLAAERV